MYLWFVQFALIAEHKFNLSVDYYSSVVWVYSWQATFVKNDVNFVDIIDFYGNSVSYEQIIEWISPISNVKDRSEQIPNELHRSIR